MILQENGGSGSKTNDIFLTELSKNLEIRWYYDKYNKRSNYRKKEHKDYEFNEISFRRHYSMREQ